MQSSTVVTDWLLRQGTASHGKGAPLPVREWAKRMEQFSKSPWFGTIVELAIRSEAMTTLTVECQSRIVSGLAGRTTIAQRRERQEREARRARRDAEGLPWPVPAGHRHETTAFWHEGGAGPVVLLLNGWTASGLLWPRAWVRRLEEHFRVVRVDNRGTGWSRTAPAPFTIGDMANDAAQVLQAIGAERATVLGLSMGGMIAQELALRYPKLVGQLILVGTRPPAPAHIPAAPDVLEHQLDRLLGAPPERSRLQAYFRSLWEPQAAADAVARYSDRFDELVDQITERPPPRVAVVNQLRAISGWTGSERLRSLTVPTSVVHGTVDDLMPVGNGMRLATLIPAARYIELPGVGHLVPLEAPEVLAEVVECSVA